MGESSAVVRTAALRGVEASNVYVEANASSGMPGMDIVGMPDSAILEARTRVRCALRACGFSIPRKRVTISLSPGEMKKTGTGFDLPIAVGILIATGQLPPTVSEGALFVGELTLEGEVRPVRGDVAYGLLAQREGLCLVTSRESSMASGGTQGARALDTLGRLRLGTDGLPLLGNGARISAAALGRHTARRALDFADVIDQELPKRAMVIAAAGRHGMLMVGPPGSGKTMLAKRLPTILPPLSLEELEEAMLVHSVAGQPIHDIARGVRPFRSPHHSISTGGLVGGGRPVLPGEISLADKGVLFLDELPEFQRGALQAMRQPLEDHEVRIVRVDGVYTFPCDFQLIAAANPCPCGHLGDPGHECVCTPTRVQAYQSRIGGPLMDRIDVVCDVARPATSKVIQGSSGLSSHDMAELVTKAREFASWRCAGRQQAQADALAAANLDPSAQSAFEGMAERLSLGGRAIVRVARVARTIADLDERERVSSDDLVEALGFRSRSLT